MTNKHRTRFIYLIILLALALNGCAGSRGPTVEPPPVVTATAVPVYTATVAVQTQAAPAAVTFTPASPNATYTDKASGITFTYPGSWKPGADGRLEGTDGYAWVEVLEDEQRGPGAACQGEANSGKPGQFGAYPQIVDFRVGEKPAVSQPKGALKTPGAAQSPAATATPGALQSKPAQPGPDACLILPSEDQPASRKGEALLLAWYPAAGRPDKALALHADKAHITAIAESLRFTGATPPVAKACVLLDQPGKPVSERGGGLRFDLYPLTQPAGAAGCDPSLDPTAFHNLISEGPASERAAALVARQWSSTRIGALNKRLTTQGYRVDIYTGASGNKLVKIVRLRDGETMRANISWLGQLTISADREAFILPMIDSYNAVTFILRKDGLHSFESSNLLLFDNIFPVLVGDDEISLAYDYERYPRSPGSPALLNMYRSEQLFDTISVSRSSPARGPVRGFWAWDNHWILELPGLVYQDGQSLNEKLGYAEIFTWRLFDERPFYFFREEGGQVRISFNGATQPGSFDAVIYEPQVDMNMLLQMHAYANGLTFYALRDGIWYYVIMEAE